MTRVPARRRSPGFFPTDPDLGGPEGEKVLQVFLNASPGLPLQGLAQQDEGDQHGSRIIVKVYPSDKQEIIGAVEIGAECPCSDEGFHAEGGM